MLDRYRRELENEMARPEFLEQEMRIRRAWTVFEKYPTREDLVRLMAQGGPRYYSDKDRILGILLREFRKDNMLFPLLNLLFWKPLAKLYHRFLPDAPEPEALLGQIQWEFFRQLLKYDLETYPKKIHINIALNTRREVNTWMTHQDRGPEDLNPPDVLDEIPIPQPSVSDWPVPPEEIEPFLMDLRLQGLLSPIQLRVIVETYLHADRTVTEWARKNNIPLRTALSHHRRALRIINRHLKRNRE
jgi:hypothetical protein